MSRARERLKRMSRSVWFAAHRVTRDCSGLGVGFVEVVYLIRRGTSRPARVQCVFSDGSGVPSALKAVTK